MVASEFGDLTYLLDLLKEPVLAVQEFFLLAGKAFRNIFRRPHYGDDIILQMDIIGVGSLPIVRADRLLQRRRDGAADVARAGAVRAGGQDRDAWYRSPWCANWVRC